MKALSARETSGADARLVVTVVNSEEGFAALRDRWNALLASSASQSFFLRWEWLWNWWNSYKDSRSRLSILLVRKGEEIVGIAPLYVATFRWKGLFRIRRMMLLGTVESVVVSEYMDIISLRGCVEEVVREVLGFIARENLCDDMSLQKMDLSSETVGFIREAGAKMGFLIETDGVYKSPYMRLPEDYGTYLASIGPTARYRLAANTRRLNAHGVVVFRKTSSEKELDGDFRELVRLHMLRWKTLGVNCSFSEKRFFAFQERVMRDMFRDGHLDLWFLSVGGKGIAALYNIVYRDRIYYYQSGLDVSFDRRISPGFLLHNNCVKRAVEDGVKEYDFLLMGKRDSYKERWTRDFRYQCDLYVAPPGIIKFLEPMRGRLRNLYSALRDGRGRS